MQDKERLSLADAAERLGLTQSGVRARFKAGKISGDRDNTGKIWVYLDPSTLGVVKPSVQPSVKGAVQGANAGEIEALRELSDLLKGQVADLTADRDALRLRADDAAKLETELAAIRAKLDVTESSHSRERKEAADTIADLRARLMQEGQRLEDALTDARKARERPKRFFGWFGAKNA